MASNPPPAPLLQSFADTPEKKKDIQALHMFLYLLREQTGGDSGILPISGGGTGADNAADARRNLGLEIGVDVQAYSAFLDEAIAFFTNTDITGAEAETLTDGSNADLLHTHAGSSFTEVNATSDYTASSGEDITATNGARITFPLNPTSQSEFIVRKGDARKVIGLDGNGKNINGSATGKLYRQDTSIRFRFNALNDQWVAI